MFQMFPVLHRSLLYEYLRYRTGPDSVGPSTTTRRSFLLNDVSDVVRVIWNRI